LGVLGELLQLARTRHSYPLLQISPVRFLELVVLLVYNQVVVPTDLYLMVYDPAPATAFQPMVADVVVMLVAVNPVGAGHVVGQGSVVNVTEADQGLSVVEPEEETQMAWTWNS
jgi:hypothetical protein